MKHADLAVEAHKGKLRLTCKRHFLKCEINKISKDTSIRKYMHFTILGDHVHVTPSHFSGTLTALSTWTLPLINGGNETAHEVNYVKRVLVTCCVVSSMFASKYRCFDLFFVLSRPDQPQLPRYHLTRRSKVHHSQLSTLGYHMYRKNLGSKNNEQGFLTNTWWQKCWL